MEDMDDAGSELRLMRLAAERRSEAIAANLRRLEAMRQRLWARMDRLDRDLGRTPAGDDSPPAA